MTAGSSALEMLVPRPSEAISQRQSTLRVDWTKIASSVERNQLTGLKEKVAHDTGGALPGRFEVHQVDGVPVVVDGGHNAAGVSAAVAGASCCGRRCRRTRSPTRNRKYAPSAAIRPSWKRKSATIRTDG